MIQNFEGFMEKVKSYAEMSENDLARAYPFLKLVKLKKNDFFVKKGQVCKEIAFVNKGLLRTFYTNTKSEEVTYCFCSEHFFTTSFQSFITQKPSKLTIHAMEETELITINYEDLQMLYAKSAAWQELGRKVAEKEYLQMAAYAAVLNNESAKEKYMRLLNEQPQIALKASVEHIASYLGVTRRTLSRIRKELSSVS